MTILILVEASQRLAAVAGRSAGSDTDPDDPNSVLPFKDGGTG